MEKKLNLSIKDGDEFFAHELSVNYSPTQFIMDFRCITPRTDPRSQESAVLAIKHNVIMTEAWHAKKIYELMGNVIKKYEEEYGQIEMPKSLKKFEKNKTGKVQTPDSPSYFG